MYKLRYSIRSVDPQFKEYSVSMNDIAHSLFLVVGPNPTQAQFNFFIFPYCYFFLNLHMDYSSLLQKIFGDFFLQANYDLTDNIASPIRG